MRFYVKRSRDSQIEGPFTPDQINQMAMANLASDPVEGIFEITSFATFGKAGALKSNIDPATVV